MTEPMQFSVDGLDPELVEQAKQMANELRKQNRSPRGPLSVQKPLTGRRLRRAMGQTNKGTQVKLASEVRWFNNTTTTELFPSPRAPKRISGSRKKTR